MLVGVNLLLGLLFGLGLVLSGMADPAKVQNFLDVTGSWDPSLAFVMAGAVAVTSVGFGVARARTAPMLDSVFQFPQRQGIDVDLVGGAALFGIGWGLGGLCPGPALTGLPLAATGTLVFVPSMLAGVALGTWVGRMRRRPERLSLGVELRSPELTRRGGRCEPLTEAGKDPVQIGQ